MVQLLGNHEGNYLEIGAMSNPQITIRSASPADVSHMVRLSSEKRASYAEAMPRFWRPSREADEVQTHFFERLLDATDHYVLVAQDGHGDVVGFCITRIVSAPPVYDPGGETGTIDDFAVAGGDGAWQTVGRQLLAAARDVAASRGVVQLVVVAGAHDRAKRQTIESEGLSETSIWYTGSTGA